MRFTHILLAGVVGAVVLVSASGFAQQSASATATAAAEIKPVIVPVVVRDKRGNLVPNLTQTDFSLQASSKPQTITSVEHESTLPITFGVLVDVSPGQSHALDEERTATAAFLNKTIAPPAANKAFVVQFARNVELLEDVTDSHPKLQRGLQQLATAAPGQPTFQPVSTGTDDSENGHARAGSALYDAVFLSSDEITSKQPGRRVLVLITDGVDRNSKESIASSIEAAQRADTILYAVYVRSEQKPESRHDNNNGSPNQRTGYPGSPGGYPGGGGYPGSYPGGTGRGQPGTGTPSTTSREPLEDGKKNLVRMCGETGGRVFELSKHEPLEMIYDEIAEELHAQYRLTFTPTADITKDGYHEVDVALTGALAKSKANLQTRDGYFTTN